MHAVKTGVIKNVFTSLYGVSMAQSSEHVHFTFEIVSSILAPDNYVKSVSQRSVESHSIV